MNGGFDFPTTSPVCLEVPNISAGLPTGTSVAVSADRPVGRSPYSSNSPLYVPITYRYYVVKSICSWDGGAGIGRRNSHRPDMGSQCGTRGSPGPRARSATRIAVPPKVPVCTLGRVQARSAVPVQAAALIADR